MIEESFRFNPLGGGAGSGSSLSQLTQTKTSLRFNPLGGGAGSGSHGSRLPGGRACRHVSIPSEVGRGRARWTDLNARWVGDLVSIPSEVGRGRALTGNISETQVINLMFQSPRRWGGVGLPDRILTWSDSPSVSIPSEVGRGRAQSTGRNGSTWITKFQSPRRWGGVGLVSPWLRRYLVLNWVSIPSEVGRGRARSGLTCLSWWRKCRFNPLGGGAGSGSQARCYGENVTLIIEFQSPRRWGGVGLTIESSWHANVANMFQSPRRWGGVGLLTMSNEGYDLHHCVSIPSEVGRGRAQRSL